jgi:hypothetical protein
MKMKRKLVQMKTKVQVPAERPQERQLRRQNRRNRRRRREHRVSRGSLKWTAVALLALSVAGWLALSSNATAGRDGIPRKLSARRYRPNAKNAIVLCVTHGIDYDG